LIVFSVDKTCQLSELEHLYYKLKIADVACEGNTPGILPTALGKTVIPAMVARVKRKLLKYLTNNLKKKKTYRNSRSIKLSDFIPGSSDNRSYQKRGS